MDLEKINIPLSKEEYLQMLKNKIVTSSELDEKYRRYLNAFYGYEE